MRSLWPSWKISRLFFFLYRGSAESTRNRMQSKTVMRKRCEMSDFCSLMAHNINNIKLELSGCSVWDPGMVIKSAAF